MEQGKRIIEKQDEKGVIALEACLSLTLFMFLVLLMYSFFVIFEAQYSVEHALLECSKSMAVESYATSKVVEEKGIFSAGDIGSIMASMGVGKSTVNSQFASYTTWYKEEKTTVAVAKERVKAYLGGDNADQYLKRLRVQDGFSGLDFTGTKVSGDDLIISVKFRCKTLFELPLLNFDHVDFSLSAKAAMWK